MLVGATDFRAWSPRPRRGPLVAVVQLPVDGEGHDALGAACARLNRGQAGARASRHARPRRLPTRPRMEPRGTMGSRVTARRSPPTPAEAAPPSLVATVADRRMESGPEAFEQVDGAGLSAARRPPRSRSMEAKEAEAAAASTVGGRHATEAHGGRASRWGRGSRVDYTTSTREYEYEMNHTRAAPQPFFSRPCFVDSKN
jgi:hypothetical protein